MNSVPDPSISKSSASRADSESAFSLEDGLKALRQKKYEAAIAQLEPIYETSTDKTTRLRAQMGLVTAYERSGQTAKAIALCQGLLQSNNPQVQDWANRSLSGFATHYPHLLSSAESPIAPGNIPADNTPSDRRTEPKDATGFVPFEQPATSASTHPSPHQSASPPDATGFVPFEKAATAEKQHPIELPKPASPNSSSQSSSPSNLQDAEPSIQTTRPAATPSQYQPGTLTNQPLSNPTENLRGTASPPLPNMAVEPPASLPTYQPIWRQADRAQHWKPLQRSRSLRFWLIQAGTTVVVFLLVRGLLKLTMKAANYILYKLPYVWPVQIFYRDPFWFVLIVIAILLLASPWLIDGLLKWMYDCRPLPLMELNRQNSEAASTIQRFCRKHRLPLPKLRILPTAAPIAFTYGNWPRTARIVVSQGLLDRLATDEIATIYASELGHIYYRDFIVLSWATLITQIPYLLYQKTSQIGDWLQARSRARIQQNTRNAQSTGKMMRHSTRQKSQAKLIDRFKWFILDSFLPDTLALIAAVSYGIYWLFRWPALWLSRVRVYYSDRIGAEATGNPNGLTRALVKISIGMADDIQQQGYTSYLMESFDLLMPISHRLAAHVGSLYPYTSLEPILEWDRRSPHRQWLTVNQSHPPTGDRLQLLTAYARYWKLDTELDFEPIRSRRQQTSGLDRSILLQGAPFFGAALGVTLAGILWGMGAIDKLMRGTWFSWMVGDWSLIYGFILIGISVGLFLRINPFFPDIKPGNLAIEPELPALLMDPLALPLNGQPVRLRGKLLGRQGIGNWLGQDLILQTAKGLIKLHYFAFLGPVGNLIHSFRPNALVNQTVEIEGWFRRGATPWVDIEKIRRKGSRGRNGGHPLWSTLLAIAIAFWGILIIFRGNGF